MNKVIQLLTDLKSKIKVERLEAYRVHKEFIAWCKTQSSDLTLAVETGSKEKADLKASLCPNSELPTSPSRPRSVISLDL